MNPDFIEELAPELQPLLLRPKDDRDRLLQQTRQHIESSGFTNPLNWLYSKAEAPELADRAPCFEGLRPEDAKAFRTMGFVPLQVTRSQDHEVERWSGPDGAICLETLGKKYFMHVLFDDGYKIAVVIDDAMGRKMAENNPTSGYIFASGDPRDDYVTLLEQLHAYSTRVGAQPLYRFDSAAVDLALYTHYLRHFATFSTIKQSMQNKAIEVLMGGSEEMAHMNAELEKMSAAAKKKAFGDREFAKVDAHGLVVTCSQCRQKNRVPFERLNERATCAACGHGFAATAQLARFETCEHFEDLVRLASVPVVVGFTHPLGVELSELVDALDAAATWSDGAALVLYGDLSNNENAQASVKFGQAEAALVRVKNGDYGHAEVRSGAWDRKVAVGFVSR